MNIVVLMERCKTKNDEKQLLQTFINYNCLYTRFCACKRACLLIGNHACKTVDMHDNNVRKCTKLVLKPLAAKNSLFHSCLIAPFL